MDNPTRLDRIIRQAKKDNRKGNYRVYEWYKRYIQDMGLSTTEYEAAVRRIASALRV